MIGGDTLLNSGTLAADPEVPELCDGALTCTSFFEAAALLRAFCCHTFSCGGGAALKGAWETDGSEAIVAEVGV